MKNYLLAGFAFLLVLLMGPWIAQRAEGQSSIPDYTHTITGTAGWVTPAHCGRGYGGGLKVELCQHGVAKGDWTQNYVDPPFVTGGYETAKTRGTSWIRITHIISGRLAHPRTVKMMVQNTTNGQFKSASGHCTASGPWCPARMSRSAELDKWLWEYRFAPDCKWLNTWVTSVVDVWPSADPDVWIHIQLDMTMHVKVCGEW